MKKYNIILIMVVIIASHAIGQDCNAGNINQTTNITTDQTISTEQILIATNQISNAASVTYQAGDFIQLGGGFFVTGDSDLLAKIDICVSTNDLDIPGFQISVLNNPTFDNFKIEYTLEEETNIEITLWDLLGRKLTTLSPMQREFSGTNLKNFNLSNFPSGSFLLHFRTNEGKIHNSKLVKI